MQAQTVARRVDEARMTWDELDRIATQHGLPERMLEAMFDAVLGYRVRRSGNDSARSGSHFATRTRGCEPGSQSRSNKEFLRFAIPLTSSR